jgi:hypothetical protein
VDSARLGGVLTAIGAVGVVATSLSYLLSPQVGAMPTAPLDLAAAQAGAAAGLTTMAAAGAFGIAGDLIWAVGAALLARRAGAEGRGLAESGWTALVFGLLIFTLVDAMVGFVLPQIAAMAGAETAFAGFKRLFDALFLLGAVASAAGIALAMGGEAKRAASPVARPLAWALTGVGVIGVGAALAGFVGWSGAVGIIGASIGLISILSVPVGLQIARARR